MKKQLHRTLFRAVLLLLSLMCLALLVSSVVMAETTLTLKLNFEPTYVESCEVVVDGVSTVLTPDNNQAISIPYNAEVQVTITAKAGYQADSLTMISGGAVDLQNNKTILWKNFSESCEIKINCVERQYDIKLLDYDRTDKGGDVYYTPVSGDEALFAALQSGLKYQRGKNEICLPYVEMSGYTFKGWRIKSDDNGSMAADLDAVGERTGWYLNTSLAPLKYFDDTGVIYIYPEMEPNTVNTYRIDCIYDGDPDSTEDKLLSSSAVREERKVDTTYSAIIEWGDEVDTGYKNYPGYEIMLDEGHVSAFGSVYSIKKVGPTDKKEDANTVKRYYTPINYTLIDKAGTPLGTYTYGSVTNIAQPTRNGYTFVGWTVEVWRGGEWVTVMHADDQNTYKNADGDLLYPNVSRPDLTLGNKPVTLEGGRKDDNAIYASEKNEAGNYEIRLIANWKANSYSLTYDWGLTAPSEALLTWMDNAPANIEVKKYTGFTFDKALSLPSPVRFGYTFAGWTVCYKEAGSDAWTPDAGSALLTPGEDGMTVIPTGTYYYDLKLIATWRANRYTVVLDPAGGKSAEISQLENVAYGASLSISEGADLIPVRRGYSFGGFYSQPNGAGVQYITAGGDSTDALWVEESENGTVVLYAHWILIGDIYSFESPDGDIIVEVEKGLHPDTTMTLTNVKNFDALAKKLLAAIRTSGKITVDGFMTIAEAEQALRELDVFAFYCVELKLVEAIKQGEVFTVKLRLSDALKGRTGLQVVYYDEETGMVEVLETETQGEYLVFRADRLANFAVMADPILNTIPLLIILGLILLFQIIAIAFLLIVRMRARQQATLSSVAFPAVALVIRFMPAGGEWLALIMAALVVILQVILTLLLLRSDFIYRPRTKKDDTDDADTEAPADAFADAADDVEQEDTEYASEESTFGYGATDPFADYDTDVDDGEDFIEPAATTKYSLPEDAEAFAYADDEDADVTEEFFADAEDAGDAFAYADEEESYDEDVAYDEEAYADEDAAEYDAGAYVDDGYFDSEEPAEEVIYVDENGEIIEGYVEEDGDIIEDYVEETDETSEDDFYRYDE